MIETILIGSGLGLVLYIMVYISGRIILPLMAKIMPMPNHMLMPIQEMKIVGKVTETRFDDGQFKMMVKKKINKF